VQVKLIFCLINNTKIIKGDCFTASFSMLLVEEKGIQECMKFASACAYLCICSFGAMPSLPTLKEYNEKIKNRLN